MPQLGTGVWPMKRCCRSWWSTKNFFGGRTPTSGSWRTTLTTSLSGWWRRRPASCECPTSHPGKPASSPIASGANRTVFIVEKRVRENRKEERECVIGRDHSVRFHLLFSIIGKKCWSCTFPQVLSRVTFGERKALWALHWKWAMPWWVSSSVALFGCWFWTPVCHRPGAIFNSPRVIPQEQIPWSRTDTIAGFLRVSLDTVSVRNTAHYKHY